MIVQLFALWYIISSTATFLFRGNDFDIQIMGYLSGSSPHIKSGAVSALSVLVYQDADICLSMPDLVPSILSLLHTKSVEVIKVNILLLSCS